MSKCVYMLSFCNFYFIDFLHRQIHPRATLSKIYFENIFCLLPYPSASTSHHPIDHPPGTKSELGVKIALGDTGKGDWPPDIKFQLLTMLQMVSKQPILLFSVKLSLPMLVQSNYESRG